MAELTHHGILGQKWGVRRYQNPDGTLTEAGKRRYGESSGLSKKDARWVDKKSGKVTERAQRQSRRELERYQRELLKQPGAVNKNGKLSAATVNMYNRKMAELMNQKVSDLRAPSGKAVQFVAKRGEIGVYMALADAGYDMSQLKNGIWDSGRIAYRKTVLDKA